MPTTTKLIFSDIPSLLPQGVGEVLTFTDDISEIMPVLDNPKTTFITEDAFLSVHDTVYRRRKIQERWQPRFKIFGYFNNTLDLPKLTSAQTVTVQRAGIDDLVCFIESYTTEELDVTEKQKITFILTQKTEFSINYLRYPECKLSLLDKYLYKLAFASVTINSIAYVLNIFSSLTPKPGITQPKIENTTDADNINTIFQSQNFETLLFRAYLNDSEAQILRVLFDKTSCVYKGVSKTFAVGSISSISDEGTYVLITFAANHNLTNENTINISDSTLYSGLHNFEVFSPTQILLSSSFDESEDTSLWSAECYQELTSIQPVQIDEKKDDEMKDCNRFDITFFVKNINYNIQ